ncbi:MAG: signal peptidase II [Rhizobiaceae bacterium]
MNAAFSRPLLFYPVAVAVFVALDQWVKYLVETALELRVEVEFLPFLSLYRTYNTGVAFSMFSWVGDVGLIALSVCVVAFILYLAMRTGPGHVFARFGFALIVGGALGNLIDRAVYGHVVDYILFHTATWSFAVFNLADAFITVGAALVVLEEVLVWRRERARRS